MKGDAGGNADHKDAWHNGNGKSLLSPRDPKPWTPSSIPRLMLLFLLSIILLYLFFPVHVLLSHSSCPTFTVATNVASTDPVVPLSTSNRSRINNARTIPTVKSHPAPPLRATSTALKSSAVVEPPDTATSLQHIVFGIAASADIWDRRKEYIKLWWRPREMRGFVWLDKPVKEFNSAAIARDLPALRISSDTSSFPYSNRRGDRSAIRISRIVSETFRLRLPNVRWFVMGDDDTVFIADNLARVLSRFDYRQPYYIGSPSESHLQNLFFSYGMAYGGGGFAISTSLAAALARMQDRCLCRYPALYGSDDRIHACMAELGVPLTRHKGFHQYDVYGDLLGLLAAHPVAPLITLHHVDVVQPIFPRSPSRVAALRRLLDGPVRLDPAGVIQQSICYEPNKPWTVSVSWGFAVLVWRGVKSPREMEMPARTFLNWYRRADYTAYAFNTRPVARHPCERPFIYYLAGSRYDEVRGTTVTVYNRHRESGPTCRWRMPDPSILMDRVIVYKKQDPGLWDRAPRRNCCRVKSVPKEGKRGNKIMVIEVGVCEEDQVTEM